MLKIFTYFEIFLVKKLLKSEKYYVEQNIYFVILSKYFIAFNIPVLVNWFS